MGEWRVGGARVVDGPAWSSIFRFLLRVFEEGALESLR